MVAADEWIGTEYLERTAKISSLLADPASSGTRLSPAVMEAVVNIITATQDRRAQVLSLEPAALALALHDAEQLLQALRRQSSPVYGAPAVEQLAARFVEQGQRVVAAASSPPPSPSAAPGHSTRRNDDRAGARLPELVHAYGEDARRERSRANKNRSAAAIALLLSLGTAVWAASLDPGQPDYLARAAGPLLVVVALALTGLALLRAASTSDRSAREYTRLQRGLAGLDAYLDPLPDPAKHLLRATMTQSLFPRLLEDDDPLRQPAWPDSRDLLYTVYDVSPPAADDEPNPQ